RVAPSRSRATDPVPCPCLETLMMIRAAILLLLAIGFAVPAFADFNFQYPRTRMFSEIGRGDSGYAPAERRSGRASPGMKDFGSDEVYDTTLPRFGGFARWNYQYRWRDF